MNEFLPTIGLASLKNKFNACLFLLPILFVSFSSFGQTTIASDGFENSLSIFTQTTGTAAYSTGNTAAADGPSTSPQAIVGSFGYSAVNTTSTITSDAINTLGFSSVNLTMRVMAVGVGSTTAGIDPTDQVRVEISPDGGTTYTLINTIQGPAANNANWAYSATGVATTPYSTPAVFAPASSGTRTTDGYSTLTITSLPNVSNLRVRITIVTNATSERLIIDDFKITGTPVAYSATGANIVNGGVNFVGQINGYSQPTNCTAADYRVLQYRKVSTTSNNTTDGRGQWFTSIKVKSAGGNVAPSNMAGGGGAGFLFTSGDNCSATGTYTNKWVFNSTTQATLNTVNITVNQGSTDMGINMGTAGYYSFTMKDVYNSNGPAYYVGYTANPPVNLVSTTQTAVCSTTATVTATIDASPSSGEVFYLRYRATTNDFTASTSQVLGTVSGNTVTFNITGLTNGVTYFYYILSTTNASYTTLSEVDKSLSCMRYLDNSGSNYSFTTVNLTPSISAQPTNSASTVGSSTTYTVTATNVTSYQWQYATTLGGTYANVVNTTPTGTTYSGNTTATLTVTTTTTTPGSAYFYRCVLTNACNVVNSNGAQMIVYCAATGNITFQTGTTLVNYAGINNSTPSKTAGYNNYTAQNASVTAGSANNITINVNTAGGYTTFTRVYIDWDQNGVFNTTTGSAGGSGETYLLGSANTVNNVATSLSPLSITVPSGAVIGKTRMRVVTMFASGGTNPFVATSMCDNSSYDGEVEDYSVTVAAACTQPTTQATIGAYTANTTGTSLTVNWSRGNGTGGVVVVARATATPAVDPTFGTTYTTNTVFGSGTGSAITGTGNFVVFNGTGTTVNVTGLTAGTSYTFSVYEYNTGTNCYMTPGSSSAVTTCTTGTPSVSIAASPSGAICAATSVTFTATPTNGGTPSYQWKLNGGNVGTNSTTYTNAALANGDQVSCVMTNSAACTTTATSTTITMSVSAAPTTSSAGSPQTICSNATATLAANTATVGTGTWSVTSGPSTLASQFSNVNSPTAVFTPAGGAGTYVLTWTIANSPCTASASNVTITVNAAPSAVTITPSAPACANTITTLTASATTGGSATTVIGTQSGTTSTNTITPYRLAVTTAARNQYFYTKAELNAAGITGAQNITSLAFDVTNTSGFSAMAGYDIQMANTTSTGVATTFTFTGGSLTTVYSGTNITPTTGLNTYNFSTPFAWDGNSNIIINICMTSTGTAGTSLTVKAMASVSPNASVGNSGGTSCSTNSGGTAQGIRPLITLGYNSVVAANITWATNTNGLWTDATANTTAYTNQVTGTVYAKPSNTQTYTATATAANSCTTSATTTLTINQLSQGSLTANGPFCNTGSGQLTWTATAGTGPYTVVYNDGTANRTATGVVSGTPFAVFTTPVTSTTTYTLVSVTDSSSTTCARTTGFTGGSATITVSSTPTTANAGPDQLVCSTNTITLAANIATSGIGAWSIIGGSGGTVTTPSSPTSTFTGTTGTTYTLRWTISSGVCTASTDDVVITILSALDYVNLQFPGAATICAGGSLTAYGQVYEPGVTPGAGQGANIVVEFGYNLTNNTNPSSWSNWFGATYNSAVTGNNDEYQYTFTPPSSGTFYYTFRYKQGTCDTWQYGGFTSGGGGTWGGPNVSGVLTVNGAPIIASISAPTALCPGDSLNPTAPTVTANGSTVSSQGWQIETAVGSGTFVSLSLPYTVAFADNGEKIRYTATNGCGTTNGNQVVLTVNSPSTAASITGTTAICSGSSTNLVVTITGGTSPFTVVLSDGTTLNSYVSGTNIPVTPSTTTAYTITSVTSTGGCAGTGNIGTATVTVNSASTAAVISGTTSICSGSSTNLSVAITGGTSPFTVVYTDGTNNFTVSSYTSGSSISVSPTSTTTYSLVSVTSTGGCVGTGNSGSAVVTVNTGSTAAVITGGADLCLGSSTNLQVTITGGTSPYTVVYTVGTLNSYVSGTNISVSPSSTTSYTITSVTDANGCVGTGNSGSAVVNIRTTTTIDGGVTWDNGTPDATRAIVFDGTTVPTGTIGANMTGCSLRVTNNALVSVTSGFNVTLSGAITVDSGSTFTLNNNANLLQGGTTNTNSGNIVVKRNSSALKRLDYTLWSSPVSGQGLYAFSPFTFANRFYVYRTNTNFYNNADIGFNISGLNSDGVNGTDGPTAVPFATAKGYLIRTPWNHPTVATVWNGTFTGVPNNGDINYTMTSGAEGFRFNLVGNPYPSPISMSQFVLDNSTKITGTLYFWRETNSNTNNNAYCTWAGGTFTTNNQAQVVNPNGIIRTGQGFFVEALASQTELSFKNGQRSNNTSDQFFRTDANATNTEETNRFWLNLTNASGEFSQMAAGYMTDATDGVDMYDGKNINTGNVLLNSILDNTDYTIQGKALPFTSTDVIPLSCKITTAGQYTIAIDHVDGLFANGGQSIYLKDNLTNSIYDLSTGGYTFTSDAGSFNTRFEIVYQSALGTTHPTFTSNNVVIYRQNYDFVVNTGSVIMSSVKVFDIRGRLLLEKKGINSNQTLFNVGEANQVLLVQITSEDGGVVTKKVVR